MKLVFLEEDISYAKQVEEKLMSMGIQEKKFFVDVSDLYEELDRWTEFQVEDTIIVLSEFYVKEIQEYIKKKDIKDINKQYRMIITVEDIRISKGYSIQNTYLQCISKYQHIDEIIKICREFLFQTEGRSKENLYKKKTKIYGFLTVETEFSISENIQKIAKKCKQRVLCIHFNMFYKNGYQQKYNISYLFQQYRKKVNIDQCIKEIVDATKTEVYSEEVDTIYGPNHIFDMELLQDKEVDNLMNELLENSYYDYIFVDYSVIGLTPGVVKMMMKMKNYIFTTKYGFEFQNMMGQLGVKGEFLEIWEEDRIYEWITNKEIVTGKRRAFKDT